VEKTERGIERTIVLYGQLLDDLRMQEWGELFTDDAVWAIPGTAFRGRSAIVAGVRAMEPPAPGSVKHLAFTPVIDLVGEREALAWTDFLALARNAAGAWELAAAGRYHDRLVASGGRWRFASRVVRIDGAPLPETGMAATPGA
jgi:hypothetical protein